jgi:preprotein translocase subunit SecG
LTGATPVSYTKKIGMYILVTVIHVLVCVFLIIVVLLQSGKAADLAGAFGGMGSQTAFGPRGSATLLSKATTISAIVFMCTSLALSILATRGSGGAATVLERSAPAKQTAPAGVPPAAKPQSAPAKK